MDPNKNQTTDRNLNNIQQNSINSNSIQHLTNRQPTFNTPEYFYQKIGVNSDLVQHGFINYIPRQIPSNAFLSNNTNQNNYQMYNNPFLSNPYHQFYKPIVANNEMCQPLLSNYHPVSNFPNENPKCTQKMSTDLSVMPVVTDSKITGKEKEKGEKNMQNLNTDIQNNEIDVVMIEDAEESGILIF